MSEAAAIDSITASVVQGALENIAVEMGYKLMRMSYSSIIRESEDFGAALVDAAGRGLAESAQSTPLQSGPIPGYIRGILKALETRGDRVRPGDVIMHNDAYGGASHGPDVAFAVPVFHQGELVAFAATTAHHLDIGALTPGSCGIVDAIDAYAEGLQFKAIKVYDRGTRNDAVWQLLRDNIRVSDLVVGDMEAQIAAANIGAARLAELIEHYGYPRFTAACEAVMAYAERLMRQAIAALPDGDYRAETMIDGYVDSGDPAKRHLPIVATVRVRGDEMEVDLSGTADQVPDRPINMPFEGTVDVAVWLTVRSVLLDTAICGDIPVKIGNLKVIAFSGMRGGAHWVHMEIFEGSYGGRRGLDGMDAVDTLYANTRNNPIEDIESHLPLRVSRYELRENACGAGEWRGGLGSVREFEYLAAGGASVEADGHVFAPWPLAGGRPGHPAELRLVRQSGDVELLPSKVPHMPIRAGDRFISVGPAGGGYGDPLARDPSRVRDDIADGLISAEMARDDYGIMLGADGTIDEPATARLRRDMMSRSDARG